VDHVKLLGDEAIMTGQYHQSTSSANTNDDGTINASEAVKQHSQPPRPADGAHHDNKDLPLEPREYARISRGIDIRVVPIMFSCYFLQFLDKVIINYANVMGLQTDLHMRGNDFSWLATAFFIAFAVSEIPQGYLLQRFSVPRVLGINILGWGIIVCCTAAVQNFASLLALRILLGCFEAVISPALVLTTATWYTKRESGPRYGLWYSGLGVGQIVGGLISFAAQHGPQRHEIGQAPGGERG
jgi:sugar phosphate permease